MLSDEEIAVVLEKFKTYGYVSKNKRRRVIVVCVPGRTVCAIRPTMLPCQTQLLQVSVKLQIGLQPCDITA